MHLHEAILAATTGGKVLLAAGMVLGGAGTAFGLYRIDYERIPRVAVLSAAFFVASLIHVPLGPTAVHLTLNGLMGLILGWAAFPAIFVALLLQSAFGLGGITALGVNTLVMAVPGIACHYLLRRAVRCNSETIVLGAGFVAGAMGILLGAVLGAGVLMAVGKGFELFSYGFLAVNVPIAVLEGLITGSVVVLLRKVRPELLEAPLLIPTRPETVHG